MSIPYSFLDQIRSQSNNRSDQYAVITDEISLTYSDFLQRVESCRALLEKYDIHKHSIVGITISDQVLHLTISIALLSVGAKQIVLATHDTESVREKLARRVGVNTVIAASNEYDIPNTKLVLLLPEDIGIDCSKSEINKQGETRIDTSEEQVFLRTSGTTSDISVVAFSQQQLAMQAERHQHYADERLIKLASIEHNNAKRHHLYNMYVGGTSVFRTSRELSLPEFCHQHNVTCVDITRIHVAGLIQTYSDSNAHFPFPVTTKLRTGGASIPSDLRQAFLQCVSPNLYVRYAATEFGGISMASPEEHNDAESAGQLLNRVEVEIVDQDGSPVPHGDIGEIRLKAEGMATTYIDDPDRDIKHFRNGWFYPGDVGSIQEDGSLVVHGRQDDMMNLNGINIFPAEIERVLERHPLVKIAVALAIPSDVHGDIPVAVVELNENVNDSERVLRAYCRTELALRSPRKILALDTIPTNTQGKFLRKEIALLFQKTGRVS